MRATLPVALAFSLVACVSSGAGPTTARGTLPPEAVTVDPSAGPLSLAQAGPAPFIDVLTRARLERRLRTTVHYCIDVTGAVVYTEIKQSSRNRTFDEQVREYVAQSRYEPHMVGEEPRPACSAATLSYSEPARGSAGRPTGNLTASRADTYVPDCFGFEVVDDKVVCSRETIDKRRPAED